ncbi:hypothetical protein HQ590_11540, partial [bacterium]|nr:hypothetical protein [bacterium]
MGENRARLTLAPFRSQPQWEGRKKHQRPLFLLAAQRDDPAAAPGAPPANEPANPPADAAPQPDGPAAASERSRHDPALLRQLGSPAPAPKRGARPRTSPAVALLRTIQQDVSLRLDQIEAALQRTEQRLDEQHRHQDQPPRPTIGAAPSPPPTDQHAAELAQLRSNLQGAREELIQLEQRLLVVRREVSQSTAATIDSAPPRTPEPTAGTPTDPLSIQGEIARLRILLVDEQNQSCRLRRELTQLPKAPPAAPAPAPLPASSRPIPLPSAILSQPRSRRRWFASRSWSRRTRRALLVAAACIVTLALGQWAFHRPPVTGPTPLPPSASSEMTTDIERGSLAAKPNLPDSLTARDPSGPATADRAT